MIFLYIVTLILAGGSLFLSLYKANRAILQLEKDKPGFLQSTYQKDRFIIRLLSDPTGFMSSGFYQFHTTKLKEIAKTANNVIFSNEVRKIIFLYNIGAFLLFISFGILFYLYFKYNI